VLIGSLSNLLGMAGWRAGFFCRPESRSESDREPAESRRLQPIEPCAVRRLNALGPQKDGFIEGNRKQLAAQRCIALQLLKKIPGLSCVVPNGAFTCFLTSAHYLKNRSGTNGWRMWIGLAELLLEHAHIALCRAQRFGADEYIRISTPSQRRKITAGLTRLAHFVELLS